MRAAKMHDLQRASILKGWSQLKSGRYLKQELAGRAQGCWSQYWQMMAGNLQC